MTGVALCRRVAGRPGKMQNYPLLEAVGESTLPVMLKRGPSATMEEFFLAAEYILKTGNSRVMLCERGIRTFEDHTRFTLPLASVPYLHQTHAFADCGRSQPRHGQSQSGDGDGAGGSGGRSGWTHRRNAPKSGQSPQRRLPIADAGRFPADDGGVSQDRARAGNAHIVSVSRDCAGASHRRFAEASLTGRQASPSLQCVSV